MEDPYEYLFFYSICPYCVHYNITLGSSSGKCKSFQDGIPLEIFKREIDHRKHINGDNGIKFEPLPYNEGWIEGYQSKYNIEGYETAQCIFCKHYEIEWGIFAGTCKAYPDGVPLEIWSGEIDHSEPYPDDNGIQFEPVER
jgi:hypothetical protein